MDNKRYWSFTVLAVAAIIFAFFMGAGSGVRAAQVISGSHVQLYIDSTLVYDNQPDQPTATPTPENTATPTPSATATQIPATSTPTITATPIIGGTVAPYADGPPCLTHDDRTYHGVWDEERGCHYNHSHGDDPHELDYLFGTEIYEWMGGEISYSWETTDENLYKHGGYSWYVREYDECYSAIEDGCIMALRALVHGVGAAHGNTVPFHSVFAEALICSEVEPDACSIIGAGGWQGPADLIIDGIRVLDWENSVNRHFLTYYFTGSQGFGTWYNGTGGAIVSVAVQFEDKWDSAPPGEGCEVAGGEVVCDSYFSTPEEVLAAASWRCSDADGNLVTDNCRWNSSRRQLHVASFGFRRPFHDMLDQDGDGYMDEFRGYTDRYGWPIDGCAEPGLDCVPLVVRPYPENGTGAPVGILYQKRGDAREYDYCFDNVTGEPSELTRSGACPSGSSWSGWHTFPIER